MKINQTEFVISAVSAKQYPEDALPEIALAGRSNVGKSSLINCLFQRRKLARTSSTPGKTQTINFYRCNDAFYFADVPGYGFAKVSKRLRQSWGKMMENYFQTRETLRAVIQVVDLRHPPSVDDQQMFHFLKHLEIPVILVATKADKITKGKRHKHAAVIRKTLELESVENLYIFSAQTGVGKAELWEEIERYLTVGNSEFA